jgi:hypothetical protein
MALATIASRITDMIGSEYSTIPSLSYEDLIRAAVNSIADAINPDLLLKYAHYRTNVDSSDGMDAIEEKKILLVTREVSNSGTEVRQCSLVPSHEFDRVLNSGSIYFATAESPVYTIEYHATDPKLKIAPVPDNDQLGYVYHFNYLGTSDTPSGESDINGLPDVCLQAVVLQACVNILSTYISDFIQDEEDTEMLQMLTAQKQLIEQSLLIEINRFIDESAPAKGE